MILLNKGVKLFDKNAHPAFYGDLETGVKIPLEFDTSIIRIAAYDNGKIFRDTTGKKKVTDVNIELFADGTVKYSININKKGSTPDITVPLNTLAPNGVIYVER